MCMLMDDSLLPTWRSLENPSAVTDPCGERQKPEMKGGRSSSPEKRSKFCPTWLELVAAELSPVLGTYRLSNCEINNSCFSDRAMLGINPALLKGKLTGIVCVSAASPHSAEVCSSIDHTQRCGEAAGEGGDPEETLR